MGLSRQALPYFLKLLLVGKIADTAKIPGVTPSILLTAGRNDKVVI